VHSVQLVDEYGEKEGTTVVVLVVVMELTWLAGGTKSKGATIE
jgi:hypothetical protein